MSMQCRIRIAALAVMLLGNCGAIHAQSTGVILAPGQQPTIPAGTVTFTPPDPSTIPNTPLGDMIRFGRNVFVDTQKNAKPYVGNGLNCVNCHLDAGRAPNSAPLWAAYVVYPLFRSVNEQVNTFALMLEYCFRYSMNGRMPPPDSPVVVGLISYSYWLATGAPVGTQLAGRGYLALADPQRTPDATRGQQVFTSRCAACHGADGGGLKSGATWTFPALWGRNSYSAGAGMYKVPIAAAFIKAKMPFGQGESLSDEQAWDVAAFINSKPRPRDPGPVRGQTP
jgi:thiosulfate dehydrogenase